MASSSDSDEFDTDFVSAAIRNTNAAIKKGVAAIPSRAAQNAMSASATSKTAEADQDPAEDDLAFGKKSGAEANRKKGKKTKRRSNENKDYEDSFAWYDNEKNNLSKSINVTPPPSPGSANVSVADTTESLVEPARRSSRRSGTFAVGRRASTKAKEGINRRSKKTSTALKKLLAASTEDKVDDWNLDEEEEPVLKEGDEEEQFMVKIEWKFEIMRLLVYPRDRVGSLLDRVAKKLDKDPSTLQLAFKDESLRRDQTFASKKIGISSILELKHRAAGFEGDDDQLGSDQIELKLRTKDKKSEMSFVIGISERLLVVMKKYAGVKGVDVDSLRFVFDGEDLNPNETPEDLDLEGGECIDVY